MAIIISGKEIAQRIRSRLGEQVDHVVAEQRRRPGLAVIQVGSDPASSIYVRNKKKACESTGIISFGYEVSEGIELGELMELIQFLNQDERVDGILCQLPLPEHLAGSESIVLDSIDPQKDVDGFHPLNTGLLEQGRPQFIPCTPAGIMTLLETLRMTLVGKHAVVVGRSNIVGKPVAQLLLAAHCTVTTAHSRTKNLAELCRSADILVAAAGRPGLITADFVRDGQVVIDVGVNRLANGELMGDVDFDAVEPLVSAITPVPGGVGPMTIAMLLKNTWISYCRREGLDPER